MVLLLLAGCVPNPLFHVASDSGTADTGDEASSTGGASNPTTGGTSTGDGPGSGTTLGAEASGDPTSGPITGTTSVTTGVDPGTTTGPPDPDSGMDADPGGTDTDTSGGGPLCGDGILDDGEQCDDGADKNDDHASCTSQCKTAICGDGLVEDGAEQCDLGGGNNNTGDCTLACKSARCGDELVHDGVEGCDSGEKNGTGKTFCSNDCTQTITVEKQIRLSAMPVTGTLSKGIGNGILEADKTCGDGFKAMVVDGEDRIASATPWTGATGMQKNWVLKPYVAYKNILGTVVAVTGKEALLGRPDKQSNLLLNAISVASELVWTGLEPDWTGNEDNCKGWESQMVDKVGAIGNAMETQDAYLRVANQEFTQCSVPRRLYCVEQ